MEFKLKKKYFTNLILRKLCTEFLSTVFFIIIFYFITKGIDHDKHLLYIFIPMIILYEIIKNLIACYTMKKDWESLKIIIGNNFIKKTQRKKADVEIKMEDLDKITEVPSGGISIYSKDKSYIFIPGTIDEYELLKKELLKFGDILESPITPQELKSTSDQFKESSKSNSGPKSIILMFLKALRFPLVIFLVLIIFVFVVMLMFGKSQG